MSSLANLPPPSYIIQQNLQTQEQMKQKNEMSSMVNQIQLQNSNNLLERNDNEITENNNGNGNDNDKGQGQLTVTARNDMPIQLLNFDDNDNDNDFDNNDSNEQKTDENANEIMRNEITTVGLVIDDQSDDIIENKTNENNSNNSNKIGKEERDSDDTQIIENHGKIINHSKHGLMPEVIIQVFCLKYQFLF